MADDGAELHELVDANEDLEFKNGGMKVRCKSTGHEMPARLEIVKTFINAPKYRKAREWYSHDFAQYAPDITPHQRMNKHLFCALTGITLPMNPEKVKAHVASTRFKELKKAKDDKAAEAAKEAEETKQRKARFKAERERKAKEAAKADGSADASAGADGKSKKKKGKKNRQTRKAAAEGRSQGEASADAKTSQKVKKKNSEAEAKAPQANKKSGKKRPLRSMLGRRKKQVTAGSGNGTAGD